MVDDARGTNEGRQQEDAGRRLDPGERCGRVARKWRQAWEQGCKPGRGKGNKRVKRGSKQE